MVDEPPSSAPPASLPPVSVQPVSVQPASLPPGSTPSGSMRHVPRASGSMAVMGTPSGAMTAFAGPKEVKLGRLLHESKPPPRALAVFIVGIAGLALWLGLTIALPLVSGREAIMSIVIVSAFLLMPSSLAAQWAYARGMLYVAVHENGLSFRDAQGTTQLGWSEVAGIFERAYIEKTDFGPELRGSFTFVGKDRRIVIDSQLSEWLELGREARELAEAALFNAYERAAEENRALPFGKLILHPTYIETPDGRFPWSEITFLRFERKDLEANWLVQRGGYSCVSKVPTYDVANGRLLVGVLAKIGKLDGIEIAVRAELDALLDATRRN